MFSEAIQLLTASKIVKADGMLVLVVIDIAINELSVLRMKRAKKCWMQKGLVNLK